MGAHVVRTTESWMANDVAKEGDESSALRRVRVPCSMRNFWPMEETSFHLLSKKSYLGRHCFCQ